MNQTDLLQRILAAEHQAQALTEDAKAQSQNIDASIEAEIAALQERYEQDAEAYLQALRQQEEVRCRRQLQELDDKRDARLRQVEAIYQADKDRWAETIFQRIVGKAGS